MPLTAAQIQQKVNQVNNWVTAIEGNAHQTVASAIKGIAGIMGDFATDLLEAKAALAALQSKTPGQTPAPPTNPNPPAANPNPNPTPAPAAQPNAQTQPTKTA